MGKNEKELGSCVTPARPDHRATHSFHSLGRHGLRRRRTSSCVLLLCRSNSCSRWIKQTARLPTLLTFIPTEGIPGQAHEAEARPGVSCSARRPTDCHNTGDELGNQTHLARDGKKLCAHTKPSGLARQPARRAANFSRPF